MDMEEFINEGDIISDSAFIHMLVFLEFFEEVDGSLM